MNDQEKQQFVSDYLDALNKGDVERIVTLYDENGSCEDPVGRPAVVGMEAIRTFYQKAIQQGVSAESTGAARCAGSAVAAPCTLPKHMAPLELFPKRYFPARTFSSLAC